LNNRAEQGKDSRKSGGDGRGLRFERVDVKFVTGFPNLQFADVAGPIAMKENLAQFYNRL